MAIGNKSSGRTATSLRSCRSLGSRCASHYCGSRLPSHSAGLGSRRTQFDVQSGWAWIQRKQCGRFLRPRARWQCNRPCIPVRACQFPDRVSGPVVSYRRGFTAVRLTRVVGERRWKDDTADTADTASDADERPALALDGRGAAKDYWRTGLRNTQ